MTLHTSSESFCIEKCYPSFTKRKKFPNYFSVVFRHLSRQQRALAPLFCAKANPLPLEFISLFFFYKKKSSGFTNPPFTHKTRRKDSTSFPVISRVLNGFKNRLRMQTFFGHPQKKTTKNNTKQKTQHTHKKQSGRARKPCLSYSNGVASKKKNKKNETEQ